MRTSVLSALLVPILWAVAACGPTCRDIAAAESAARARTERTNAPHAQLSVPFAHANALLERQLKDLPRVPLEIPGVGGLLPNLSGFTLGVTALQLEPARDGFVGFRVQGTLFDRDQVVLRAQLVGTIEPTLERGPGVTPSLLIAPSEALLRRLHPQFDPGAAEALGDAIHRRLPAPARRLMPRRQAHALAKQLLSVFESEGLQSLQEALLPRMRRWLRLRLRLPDLPLQRIRVHSPENSPPRLTLDLYTTLAVHTGLRPSAPAGEGVTMRFAGSTVAALSNWAMAEGHLPRRYDGSLKPKADGPNTLLLDWRAAERRPLKVDIFRHRAPCAHIRVGARATLRRQDDKLVLAITERKVEQVQGSALVKLKLWYDRLWEDAVRKTHEIAASTRIEWGRRTLTLEIAKAELTRDELRFLLRVGPLPAQRQSLAMAAVP